MHSAVEVSTRYPGPVKVAGVHTHGLNSDDFASDDALAAVLDRYPPDMMDINRYSYDENHQVHLDTGVSNDRTGHQILQAVRQGELWLNLREVETYWPELWDAASDCFNDIALRHEGLKAVKRAGQLIISSPRTRVPYHFDASGVVLFHMRGRKRIYVYPGDEAHLPEEAMEKVVARQTTEELPYHIGFDRSAKVIDLMPGEAAIWPVYAPHRVENLDSFCVSLSMDYQTWASRMRTGTFYTHAVLRSRGFSPASTDRLGVMSLALRWMASLALRRMGMLENKIKNIDRAFALDESAANGQRPV